MLVSIVHRFIWIVFQPLVRVCTKQLILNREVILQEKLPVIFVSNHESHFDPFLISGATPCFGRIMPIRFFTRDIFFEQLIFKHILWLLGAFPGHIGYGLETSAEKPLSFLKQGYSIGIFPEWCFPNEPECSRMERVAPYISQKSMRPIIPVFLYGIEELHWGKVFALRKRNIISFGDPIYPNPSEPLEKYTERVSRGMLDARLRCIHYLKTEEHQFWLSYAKFYKYLELALPYQHMLQAIRSLLPDNIRGQWLDIGTGSGAMVQLLLDKLDKSDKATHRIIATYFNEDMLTLARGRFRDSDLVQVKKLDLNHTMPHEADSFSGVVANLVLPYITHHETILGKRVFGLLLGQIFRVLRPGGVFLFSTPKHQVNFILVALGSWRSFFDRQHPEYRKYALYILRHALQIQEWGRREMYNFPSLSGLEKLVHDTGFQDIQIRAALVGQVYIVSCRKPAIKV